MVKNDNKYEDDKADEGCKTNHFTAVQKGKSIRNIGQTLAISNTTNLNIPKKEK